MTDTTDVSIQGVPDNPARPPPSLVLNFVVLKEQFRHLTTMIDGMSSGYQEDLQHIDELHYQQSLDALTDQLYDICIDLGTLRATCRDHLRLKISALLYLLPEEADAELRLVKSLLTDLEEMPAARFAAPS